MPGVPYCPQYKGHEETRTATPAPRQAGSWRCLLHKTRISFPGLHRIKPESVSRSRWRICNRASAESPPAEERRSVERRGAGARCSCGIQQTHRLAGRGGKGDVPACGTIGDVWTGFEAASRTWSTGRRIWRPAASTLLQGSSREGWAPRQRHRAFRRFVTLCRELDPYGRQLLAAGGPRIKAVNGRQRSYTLANLGIRLKKADDRIERCLKETGEADAQDPGGSTASATDLAAKIESLSQRRRLSPSSITCPQCQFG